MPRIANLDPTDFPSLEASFPVTYNGETNRYTLQQVRELMQFEAAEISFSSGTVEAALIDLQSNKANASDLTDVYNFLLSQIETKASMTYVNAQLATKASITYVDEQLDLMLLPVA